MKKNIGDIIMVIVAMVVCVVVVNHAYNVGMVTVWAVAMAVTCGTVALVGTCVRDMLHTHMDAYIMHHSGCLACDEMVRMYDITTPSCAVCGMHAHACYSTVSMGSMVCDMCTYRGYSAPEVDWYSVHVEGCLVCQDYLSMHPTMVRACTACGAHTYPCSMYYPGTTHQECKACNTTTLTPTHDDNVVYVSEWGMQF